MKRILLLVVAVALATSLIGLSVGADNGPSAKTSHPIVGSWRFVVSEGALSRVTFLMTFHADGTAVGTDSQGLTWHGVWEARSDSAAAYTYESIDVDGTESIFGGLASVDPSGLRWTDAAAHGDSHIAYAERIGIDVELSMADQPATATVDN